MEELFKNETKYTQKEYDIFLKEHQKEYATSETAYMLFNIIFFGICMIFAFRNNEIILGIILLLGLLIYMWYKFIKPKKELDQTLKSEKLSGDFVNHYYFYKNNLKVENKEGDAKIYYYKLYRVIETHDNYYIYISRDYAFIMSKGGFTKGDSVEFSKFIKKKMLTKYRNRIKRSQTK